MICIPSTTVQALLLYEYLVTFDQEVELFWKRSFTGASALFFLNRYFTIIDSFSNFTGIKNAEVGLFYALVSVQAHGFS